jgi:hypothetical protein
MLLVMWNWFPVAVLAVPLLGCSTGGGSEGAESSGGGGQSTSGGSGGASASGGNGGSSSGGFAGASGAAGANGGASGASGSGGGGGSGSGGSAGGSAGPCGAVGLFVCDDFESAAPGSEPAAPNWLPQLAWQSDRIVVDASKAHSGSNSIKVVAATYGAQIYAASGFPPANNTFYVRAWMNLEKSTADMGGHVDFIEGGEAEGDSGEELRLGASHGMVDVNLIPGSKGSGGGEKTQFSNGDVDIPSDGGEGIVLQPDVWYCVEALFDGENHEFRTWIDGTEVPGLHVTDWQQGRSDWSPTYAYGKIGGQNFSGQAGTIWYDDIAFGSGPIGCD